MRATTLILLALAAACTPSSTPDPLARRTTLGPEKLSSLDVTVGFEPGGAGCVTLVNGQLPAPEIPGDYCPDGPGDVDNPLPYQTGRRVRVFLNVDAIGTRGTYQFPVTGSIGLSMNVGTIQSGTPSYLQGGRVQRQKVVFQNAPGKVQLWAEAGTLLTLPDGTDQSPTFTLGASSPLWFGQPTLPDVQRADNDLTSPLQGQRVEVQAHNLMVTRIAGNGFTVQDLGVPLVDGLPKWNGLFVFAFNGVDSITVGTRLLKLKGAITAFQGMTQLGEPEFVAVGGECAPRQEPSRYGREPTESEEGGSLIRARCPANAECVDDRCVPKNDPYEYDRLGRTVCHQVTTCGGATAECPAGTQCVDREDWRTVDALGQPAFTCQACPAVVGGELWTTPGQTPGWCGPLWTGDSHPELKMRNEMLEGALLQLQDAVVDGLDLNDDFFRSGFYSFGQWKLKLPNGACATVSSEVAPDFDVVGANANRTRLSSFTGTLRQVRFTKGSAYWMIDLRHKGDLVVAP
ncbi:MAG: hypothetical protein HY904_02620 [Deltaproteobacteria bacterium]|nr:hypothetical protein [Deltaproteobacteria bacterium]